MVFAGTRTTATRNVRKVTATRSIKDRKHSGGRSGFFDPLLPLACAQKDLQRDRHQLPLLKTFPQLYSNIFESVSVVAHICARKYNVSSVWVSLDFTDGIAYAEINNVSFAKIVEEVRAVPSDAELIEGMVQAHHCLDPYQGVVHLIMSYKNLTCSFCVRSPREVDHAKQKLIEKSEFVIIGGKQEKHFVYLVEGDTKQAIEL